MPNTLCFMELILLGNTAAHCKLLLSALLHLLFMDVASWNLYYGHTFCVCRAQAVSLNFHFAVEQRSRSFLRTFFGFNGTAGVWRRTSMEQAGGWNMESTVEDMDLSLRAYLNGWKFKCVWGRCL